MVTLASGYSVLMVVEQTTRGERRYDIFSLLLKKSTRVRRDAN
jgi:hypothetical protein